MKKKREVLLTWRFHLIENVAVRGSGEPYTLKSKF